MNVVEADVLVIGTGIAGAAAALRLARDRTRQIVLVTREAHPEESTTRYAQGGIATSAPGEAQDLFVEDVMRAGAGLSLRSAVEVLAEEGPPLVREILIEEAQVPFDRAVDGELHLTREGGHSVARVLHVGDRTGAAIAHGLHELLARFPNVRVVTRATAVDLITSPTTRAIPSPCTPRSPATGRTSWTGRRARSGGTWPGRPCSPRAA